MLIFIEKFFNQTISSAISTPERLENLKAGYIFTEDTMIVSFLSHLGFDLAHILPASSIVTFEISGPPVIKDTSSLNVKMMYNDRQIRISNCNYPLCSYENFIKTIKALVSQDNVKEKCHSTDWQ